MSDEWLEKIGQNMAQTIDELSIFKEGVVFLNEMEQIIIYQREYIYKPG